MDKFSEWLEKNRKHYALIDRSYTIGKSALLVENAKAFVLATP